MKKEDMIAIGNMRLQGKSAGAIAAVLGLSVNTVKSYLRRHPDMGCTHFCPQCGKPVMQTEGRKEKSSALTSAAAAGGTAIHRRSIKRLTTVWYAINAERSLRSMGTAEGNIAAGNATGNTGKKMETAYEPENLMAYRVSLSLIDRLFSEGVITAADRRKSYTIIAKRHGLSLDSIFTEKT